MNEQEFNEIGKRPDVINEGVLKSIHGLVTLKNHVLAGKIQLVLSENPIADSPMGTGALLPPPLFEIKPDRFTEMEALSILEIIKQKEDEIEEDPNFMGYGIPWLKESWAKYCAFRGYTSN
jgi:hypothetical protein